MFKLIEISSPFNGVYEDELPKGLASSYPNGWVLVSDTGSLIGCGLSFVAGDLHAWVLGNLLVVFLHPSSTFIEGDFTEVSYEEKTTLPVDPSAVLLKIMQVEAEVFSGRETQVTFWLGFVVLGAFEFKSGIKFSLEKASKLHSEYLFLSGARLI